MRRSKKHGSQHPIPASPRVIWCFSNLLYAVFGSAVIIYHPYQARPYFVLNIVLLNLFDFLSIVNQRVDCSFISTTILN